MTVKGGTTPPFERPRPIARIWAQSAPPRLPRPLPWVWAAALSTVAGLWVAIGEIDHVLAQILDVNRTWSVSQLTSISAVFNYKTTGLGWQFFHDATSSTTAVAGTDPDDIRGWLWEYALLDGAMALLYSALAVAWSLRPGRWRVGRRVAAVLVVLAGVADIMENLMFATGADHHTLLLVVTGVKWSMLSAGVGTAVVCALSGLVGFLRRTAKALYTHRYSVLVVLPLALLSLSRGPDLLEQIPDIQRRWSDSGNGWDFVWAGVVMSLLALFVLAIGRERARNLAARACPLWTDAGHLCDLSGHPETCPVRVAQEQGGGRAPLLRLWFIGPGVLLGAGLILQLLGAPVEGWRLLGFVILPIGIGGASFLIRPRADPDAPQGGGLPGFFERQRRKAEANPDYRKHRPPISEGQYLSTARTGDALVGLLPVIAGLGCIRAFTGPSVLGVLNGGGSFFLHVGWITLIAAYPALTGGLAVLRRCEAPAEAADPPLAAADPAPPGLFQGARNLLIAAAQKSAHALSLDRDVRQERRDQALATNDPGGVTGWFLAFKDQPVAWATLLAGLLGMAVVGSLPVPLATNAGVIATFQLGLGSLCASIAATVVLTQRGEGPELFWKLRMAYAPVTSLLLGVCLVIGLVGKWSDVHAIRTADTKEFPATVSDRPSLDTLFTDWLGAGTGCAQEVGETGLKARPLMLFAAEGGGIRAAYWTAAAVDWIQTGATPTKDAGSDADPETDPPADICRSAMLSSGASGGSVGLNVAAARGSRPAMAAVRKIAGRRALGAASVGLVLRDTIFAATGIPLPSLDDDAPGAFDWNDRGTLIEQAWELQIKELQTPFLSEDRPFGWSWGPPGALIVNSTSTTTSCRMLVSQISLPDQGAECGSDAAVAGSADLLSCTGNMRYTTAALLTSRFPYVTPSGVVKCPGNDSAEPPIPPATLQIVDGGYGDNFGVGTLVDLGPDIVGLVRRHNDCVLAAHSTGKAPHCVAGDQLVVPILVYFDNGAGSDLVSRPGGIDLEVLVPPITLLGAKSNLVSASSELQRASELLDTSQLWDQRVAPPGLSEEVATWRRASVYVISQATKPGIAAPLGWVLSDESMDEMDKALADQTPICQLSVGGPAKAVTDCADSDAPADPNKPGSLEQLLLLLK